MPRLVYAVFCQQAVVDKTTNNISIFNQYDELHPVLPPEVRQSLKDNKKILAIPLSTSLLTVWERSDPAISESSSMLVHLIGPTGKKLAQFGGNMDMRKFKRIRNVGNLPSLPLAGEGIYRFVIRARSGTKWKRAGVVTYVVGYSDGGNSNSSARLN